jgi:quercetin dioxygenase-like cupin family protein
MPLITYADAPAVEAHGVVARPLAVPSRGSTELAIWYLTVPPGGPAQTHTVDREEVFVVQTGELTGHLDGAAVTVSAGDALAVPPGVPFGLGNAGGEPATVLVCTSAGITATMNGERVVPPWSR